MPIIKTSELTDLALDWAVAKCRGKGLDLDDPNDPWLTVDGIADQPLHSYTPSADWVQGGPIIEREVLSVYPHRIVGTSESGSSVDMLNGWKAHRRTSAYWITPKTYLGLTPLIAAMRCYVASCLGDEVEIPEELI